MKPPFLLLSFAALFFCACKVDKENKVKFQPYIISKEDSLSQQKWKSKGMPPLPLLVYGDYNFVVDTSGAVYLHRKSYPLGFYDTEIDVSKLASVHLDTSDLVPMSQNDMENFLSNAASTWDPKKSVVIASFSDTITSERIYPLIEELMTNRIIRHGNIRKVTDEEARVLKNKTGRR